MMRAVVHKNRANGASLIAESLTELFRSSANNLSRWRAFVSFSKTLVTVFLALVSATFLPAYSGPDSIKTIPHWIKGETAEYEVEWTWHTVMGTHENTGWKRNRIRVEVLDSSSTGYHIAWTVGSPETTSASAFIVSQSGSTKSLRVEFMTDPKGVFQEILNGAELGQRSTGAGWGSLEIQRALMQILLYHRPYGFHYDIGDIQTFNVSRRVPASSQIVDFSALAELKFVDKANHGCLLTVTMVADSGFGGIANEYVVGLDDQQGEHDLERAISSVRRSAIMDMYILDTGTYGIKLATRKVRIVGSGFSHVETMTIALSSELLRDNEVRPSDFVAVHREPEIIAQSFPEYPELAMRDRSQGTVSVKIWVDKEGNPREVTVLKSDAEVFNEPAVRAAKQFSFIPAILNNKPVSVWVTIPFYFSPSGDSTVVQQNPQAIRLIKPEYPQLAMRAAIEGTVWVKIQIDKQGNPSEVVVSKSNAEVFEEPAIRAAKRFSFIPAFDDNRPVSTWVFVPFNFRLVGGRGR